MNAACACINNSSRIHFLCLQIKRNLVLILLGSRFFIKPCRCKRGGSQIVSDVETVNLRDAINYLSNLPEQRRPRKVSLSISQNKLLRFLGAFAKLNSMKISSRSQPRTENCTNVALPVNSDLVSHKCHFSCSCIARFKLYVHQKMTLLIYNLHSNEF